MLGYFYFTDGSKQECGFKDGTITGKASYYVESNLVSTGKFFNCNLQEKRSLDDQQLQSTMQRTLVRKD